MFTRSREIVPVADPIKSRRIIGSILSAVILTGCAGDDHEARNHQLQQQNQQLQQQNQQLQQSQFLPVSTSERIAL